MPDAGVMTIVERRREADSIRDVAAKNMIGAAEGRLPAKAESWAQLT